MMSMMNLEGFYASKTHFNKIMKSKTTIVTTLVTLPNLLHTRKCQEHQ